MDMKRIRRLLRNNEERIENGFVVLHWHLGIDRGKVVACKDQRFLQNNSDN